jgi:small subunit ribosomal protein S9
MSTDVAAEPRVKNSSDALGTGRRKSAVVRVRVRPGNGQILVNDRPFEEYFPTEKDQRKVLAALDETGKRSSVDVIIKAHGGGVSSQAGACTLGIARALRIYDTSQDDLLRHSGLLTRDVRMKERKKYGLRGARRGTQFSKR